MVDTDNSFSKSLPDQSFFSLKACINYFKMNFKFRPKRNALIRRLYGFFLLLKRINIIDI